MNRSLKLFGLAVAFDIYWTLVVVFRERGMMLWIALAVVAWLTLPPALRLPALLLSVAGCVLDALWVSGGFIHFNSNGLLPGWMMALWLTFASVWTRFTHNARFPRLLFVVIAAIGGPAAYFLGERLGALVFLSPTMSVLGWMALGWLLLMATFHFLLSQPS